MHKKILLALSALFVLLLGLAFFLVSDFGVQWMSCRPNLPNPPAQAILYFSFDGKQHTELTTISTYRLNYVAYIYHPGQLVFINGHADASPSTVPMARAFLINKGIPDQAIFDETSSRNTWENLDHALAIIQAKKVKTITFVSSPYHIDRILRYYLKQAKEKNFHFDISWGFYNHKLDNVHLWAKLKQIIHEIGATFRDTILYEGTFRSGLCSSP